MSTLLILSFACDILLDFLELSSRGVAGENRRNNVQSKTGSNIFIVDNSWAPRKTNWGKVKKIGYLGYKAKKKSIIS